MSPSAINEGFPSPSTIPTTTVVVVGAGPSGLMLTYLPHSPSLPEKYPQLTTMNGIETTSSATAHL